jgi:hypothetical protein
MAVREGRALEKDIQAARLQSAKFHQVRRRQMTSWASTFLALVWFLIVLSLGDQAERNFFKGMFRGVITFIVPLAAIWIGVQVRRLTRPTSLEHS